jgi:arylsulfatase A
MDDMGYGALSCQGNKHVQTPHLDRLASQGMRFTSAYVTPQCTPTRSSLMTGQYTARTRMFHVIPPYEYPYARMSEVPHLHNLSRDTFILPKGLKQVGYSTAAIGKWHLTANADGNYNGLYAAASKHYGFDVVSTPPKDPKEISTGDKAVNRFTDEAIHFIQKNRSNPFFLYLPQHSIHNIVSAPANLVEKYRAKGYPATDRNNATYLAALEHMDTAFGRLMQSLDDTGLAENTIVMFLTDNGGIHRQLKPATGHLEIRETLFDNAPLREGKGFNYEGGIRVPFLVRWPGRIRPNTICDTPVHAIDLLPTLLDAAGSKPQDTVDGVNITPLFEGKRIPSRPLYWYMPFYDLNWAATPAAIIRDGNYKLIEAFGDYFDASNNYAYVTQPRLELFDLAKDPGETTNLAPKDPARARRMRAQLHSWLQSLDAPIPTRNPNFNPERAFETRRIPQ